MNPIIKWFLFHLLSRPIIKAVRWTEEERSAFDTFCKSSCGIKLFEFLRQIVANATFKAVYQNSVSANAHARGMQDMLAVLHRLRVFPQEESDSYAGLHDSEPETAPRQADDWRGFIGGRGAIG